MEGRRAPLVTIVFVCTTLTWISFRAAPAAVAWVERSEEVVATRAVAVGSARERLARASVLGDSITKLEAGIADLSRHVLPGGDPGAAAIEVGRRITEALELAPTRGGDPAYSLEDSDGLGRFHRIRVRSEFTTDFEGVRDVLAQLEGDETLWIDSLDVRLEGPPLEAGQPEVLEVHLTVGAWHVAR